MVERENADQAQGKYELQMLVAEWDAEYRHCQSIASPGKPPLCVRVLVLALYGECFRQRAYCGGGI
jgi:hypothetical protein